MKAIVPIALITLSLLKTTELPPAVQATANSTLPGFRWAHARPEEVGISSQKLTALEQTLFNKGTKKLLIIKNDKIVGERFAEGWQDEQKPHYIASLAKTLVSGMSLNLAIQDGYLQPDEPACYLIPAWKKSDRKSKISIQQLATHTSGLEDAETAPTEPGLPQPKIAHKDLPGWKGQFWTGGAANPFLVARDSTKVLFTPGTQSSYSNTGIAMLTYAVTASLQKTPYHDIRTYLQKRIFEPIGIGARDYSMGYGKTYSLDSLQLVPSWGGASFTADAIARIGRLMLHKGDWQGQQLLDSTVIKQAVRYAGTALPPSSVGNSAKPDWSVRSAKNPIPAATLGWYANYDGIWNFVPRDAFCGLGSGNQLLLVVPSLDLIVVRLGDTMAAEQAGESVWGALETHLFNPLMDAITATPYPASDLITGAQFAPPSEVIRLAEGSDVWPTTWGDDDLLYTAYGDGNGFEPGTDIKLSLGLAKVSGNPPTIKGENIRNQSIERVGHGVNGVKASGILMVDGILYMLVRNAANAQLARSTDHGKTWTWADWKFETSFGCPNFINYGKNYTDARDGYVYIYSQDEASAYKNADRMVLARVPKGQVMDWRAYTYFAGYYRKGTPIWAEDIRKREAAFVNPGKCFRTGMTYSQALGRYLWCHTIPVSRKEKGQSSRLFGGLGIFEAPHPWGPWKTVFYTRDWDMSPGEVGNLPTKWMSKDGNTLYYLCSGNDAFSVRKLTLTQKR